jgi:predicted nucleotidyltransferase
VQGSPTSEGILGEIVRRLTARFPAERIYLFGSRARDDDGEDSDYDILLVLRETSTPRYRREQEAFRALCGLGVAKDVLVFTRDEFERGSTVVTSLPATVEREGRLLYAG